MTPTITANKPHEDSGVALTIRFPLVLDPADRIPGGIAVRVYAIDSGELLISETLASDDFDNHVMGVLKASLQRAIPAVMMCAYDGDDGRLRLTRVTELPTLEDLEGGLHGIPKHLYEQMNQCTASPDRACQICDDDVPGNTELTPEGCHPECALLNFVAPLVGTDKPGRTRERALRLYALVEERGLGKAVLSMLEDDLETKPSDSSDDDEQSEGDVDERGSESESESESEPVGSTS